MAFVGGCVDAVSEIIMTSATQSYSHPKHVVPSERGEGSRRVLR